MVGFRIREIREEEKILLEDFLYEAIFQREGDNLLPRDIIRQPELKVYIEDFGRLGDYCLVAEVDERIVGAVWTRILSDDVKGYGNIDSDTPEFAISVYKEYQGGGIGKKLMIEMLWVLKEQGYRRTSLAVQKDNYALKMYKAVGFSTIKETEEEYIMVCDLNTVI